MISLLSLFCFIGMLYLNNVTTSQNSANVVSHQIPQSEPPSNIIFPSFTSYIQLGSLLDTHTSKFTQSSTRHTVHNRLHEHLRHTHIHYLYLTQHAGVQSLRQQYHQIIWCSTRDSQPQYEQNRAMKKQLQYKLTDEWFFFTWPVIAF